MPELPKITPLIAATASGVDGEANGGRWGVVKNVWHRVLFSRLLSRAFHYYFFHRSHTQKKTKKRKKKHTKRSECFSQCISLWCITSLGHTHQCICCEKSQCVYHWKAYHEIVSDEGHFTWQDRSAAVRGRHFIFCCILFSCRNISSHWPWWCKATLTEWKSPDFIVLVDSNWMGMFVGHLWTLNATYILTWKC